MGMRAGESVSKRGYGMKGGEVFVKVNAWMSKCARAN